MRVIGPLETLKTRDNTTSNTPNHCLNRRYAFTLREERYYRCAVLVISERGRSSRRNPRSREQEPARYMPRELMLPCRLKR